MEYWACYYLSDSFSQSFYPASARERDDFKAVNIHTLTKWNIVRSPPHQVLCIDISTSSNQTPVKVIKFFQLFILRYLILL